MQLLLSLTLAPVLRPWLAPSSATLSLSTTNNLLSARLKVIGDFFLLFTEISFLSFPPPGPSLLVSSLYPGNDFAQNGERHSTGVGLHIVVNRDSVTYSQTLTYCNFLYADRVRRPCLMPCICTNYQPNVEVKSLHMQRL